MFNDYYLLKRVVEEEGKVAYASVMDSFTFIGEVVDVPIIYYKDDKFPQAGDKVQFLKGSGEDMGDGLKAVKFEDIIRKI